MLKKLIVPVFAALLLLVLVSCIPNYSEMVEPIGDAEKVKEDIQQRQKDIENMEIDLEIEE